MTTLAIMKARIASEIARPNLTAEIASAIADAIAVYQKTRFRWNESLPGTPVTFATVGGQSNYTSAANANIGTIFKIDYMNYVQGGARFKIERESPERVRLMNQTGTQLSGPPAYFALEGETIIIYPTPDQAYTITMAGLFSYPAPASDVEANNRWMTTAERLIRARAKYEIAVHVTRNKDMAAAMSPDEPSPGQQSGAAYREFMELKAETNRLSATGRIRATQF